MGGIACRVPNLLGFLLLRRLLLLHLHILFFLLLKPICVEWGEVFNWVLSEVKFLLECGEVLIGVECGQVKWLQGTLSLWRGQFFRRNLHLLENQPTVLI